MDKQKDTNVKENKGIEPNKETLHTTDPQENMKGPISSSTRETGDAFDSNESRENADEKRDSRM
jgi:hypothetical protein